MLFYEKDITPITRHENLPEFHEGRSYFVHNIYPFHLIKENTTSVQQFQPKRLLKKTGKFHPSGKSGSFSKIFHYTYQPRVARIRSAMYSFEPRDDILPASHKKDTKNFKRFCKRVHAGFEPDISEIGVLCFSSRPLDTHMWHFVSRFLGCGLGMINV